MKRCFVDANVLLRFLTGDPPEMAAQARDLIQAVDRGEVVLVVEEIILAEIVWVLESFYHYPRQTIAQTLQEILVHEGFEASDKAGLLLALSIYADKNIDFADALTVVRMRQAGVREIYSFDRHFDRMEDIVRLQPGETGQPSN